MFGWPQVAPVPLENPRFAKGPLAPTATMFHGARSRTPDISFGALAPAHLLKAHVLRGFPAHVTPHDAKSHERNDAVVFPPRSNDNLC